MKIGIDLDGVLFDFHRSLTEYLGTIEHEYELDDKQDSWHFYRNWGMTDEQFVKHCNDGVDAGMVFRGNIHPGAVDAIQRIKDLGHEIHIITDRRFGKTAEASENATREWLAEHEIPYDTLTFSADKTIVKTDMMVEDKIENYDALRKVGTLVFLIDRPWNRDDPGPRAKISSITDFADIVELFTQQYLTTSV